MARRATRRKPSRVAERPATGRAAGGPVEVAEAQGELDFRVVVAELPEAHGQA